MNKDKKIKIHIKNNHWAPGSFPTDPEGEKNFTITKEHLEEALKDLPEIRNKLVFDPWNQYLLKNFIAMCTKYRFFRHKIINVQELKLLKYEVFSMSSNFLMLAQFNKVDIISINDVKHLLHQNWLATQSMWPSEVLCTKL